MPHRINAAEIMRYGISVDARTAHNIPSRTGKNMGTHALHIMESVRAADSLHVDETSLLLNGKNVWVWIFLNPRAGDTLHVMRKSRGSDVIGEVLGSDWKDTLVCDGWTAYKLQCSDVPGPTCCARSEMPCARILTVRRQSRCCTSSQGRTSAGRISKKYLSSKQRTRKHLSQRKLYKYLSRRIRGILKIQTDCGNLRCSAPRLATHTMICSDLS